MIDTTGQDKRSASELVAGAVAQVIVMDIVMDIGEDKGFLGAF